MTIKPRLSIRLALVLVALVACGLAALRWNDPASRYRRQHDERSLDAVLSARVANGDSVRALDALLGPGSPTGKRDSADRSRASWPRTPRPTRRGSVPRTRSSATTRAGDEDHPPVPGRPPDQLQAGGFRRARPQVRRGVEVRKSAGFPRNARGPEKRKRSGIQCPCFVAFFVLSTKSRRRSASLSDLRTFRLARIW